MTPRTILAADDSMMVLDTLNSLLSPPHRVVHAHDGVVAWDLARALRPGLIIADITLRNLDGIELLRKVRGEAEISGTPVILWSVVYRPEHIRRLVNGLDPVVAIEKPGDIELLVSTVNGLLDATATLSSQRATSRA